MNEKFSVELELVTQKFSSKLDNMKNRIESFSNNIKNGLSMKLDNTNVINGIDEVRNKYNQLTKAEQTSLSIELGNTNIKETEQMIEDLSNTIKENEELINYGIKNPSWASWNTGTIENAKVKIKQATVELKKLDDAIESIKDNTEEVANKNIKNFSDKITKGFDKSVGKIKKFALSLFGLRSIFSLVSRASSQYLSQNEELSNKLQSAWIGLGAFFAPLIDKIANFTIKAVSYINVFIKALTGVDYLTKAMTKSMEKLNKSAKSTSKTLAGFDEITNINTDTSVSTLDTGWIDAFNDIELNSSVVSKLESMAEWLKENYKWLGLVIGSAALGTGLLGLNSILGTLTTVGVVAIGIDLLYTSLTGRDLINDLDEIKNGLKGINNINQQARDSSEILAQSTNNLIDTYKKLETTTDVTREKTDYYIQSLFRSIESNENLVNGLEKQKTWLGYITGSNEEVTKSQQNYRDSTAKVIEELGRLYEQGTLNDEQTQLYISTIETQISILENLKDQYGENSSEYKENEEQIKSLKATLKEITGEEYTIKTTLEEPNTDSYSNGITKFVYGISSKLQSWADKVGSWFSGLFDGKSSKVPSYDVGTNYVPNDQLAYIHKGEAIIPAKYNNTSYFNSNSSATNALLEELIEKVDSIDFNPYVSVKDLGEASINYINSKKRIMGRSVID